MTHEEQIADDCWNLDQTFYNWIIPRLEFLRDKSPTYPPKFVNVRAYRAMLNRIIRGFKLERDHCKYTLTKRQAGIIAIAWMEFRNNINGFWM